MAISSAQLVALYKNPTDTYQKHDHHTSFLLMEGSVFTETFKGSREKEGTNFSHLSVASEKLNPFRYILKPSLYCTSLEQNIHARISNRDYALNYLNVITFC